MPRYSPEYTAFVRDRFLKRNSGPEGIMHAAIGILGEVVELIYADSRANRIEELGDIEFYLEAFYQVLEPAPIRIFTPFNNCEGFLIYAGQLHDLAKKVWVYNKPIDPEKFHSFLDCISQAVIIHCEINGVTRDQVIAENVTKLLKRYPTGYTDALAQARMDKNGGEDIPL